MTGEEVAGADFPCLSSTFTALDDMSSVLIVDSFCKMELVAI
jgi:hypothetical protein